MILLSSALLANRVFATDTATRWVQQDGLVDDKRHGSLRGARSDAMRETLALDEEFGTGKKVRFFFGALRT